LKLRSKDCLFLRLPVKMTELGLLLAELVSGNDERAERAAIQFSAFGSTGIDALKPLLISNETDVRWWAVRALAGFEQLDETSPELVAALEDESDEVRQAAAMALCHHPRPQAVPPLIRALSDPDTMTARLASNALARIGLDATHALLDVLKTGTGSARLEAARALAEIKDPRAIPGLMQALETDSALLQYWVGNGLDKLDLGMVYLKPE
jgi:HEAT repeat protein